MLSQRDERADLVQLHARFARSIDQDRFDELDELVLTDPVTFDYPMSGMPPTTLPRREVVAILRGSVAPFAATLHSITGHIVDVDGDRATVHAQVRTELWVPGHLAGDGPRCWLVVGFYDNEAIRTADGWRFSRLTFTLTHQENAHLAELARAALPS